MLELDCHYEAKRMKSDVMPLSLSLSLFITKKFSHIFSTGILFDHTSSSSTILEYLGTRLFYSTLRQGGI